MVENHVNIANEIVKRTQNGKYNGAKPEYYVQKWDDPCRTLTHTARSGDGVAHPGDSDHIENEGDPLVYNVTPQQPKNGYTVNEFFAGGGLMAVGMRAAGFTLQWANDFQKKQCEAYAHNLGAHIVCGDITAMDPDEIPDADIFAGGPPCQDFSIAGKGEGEEGQRGMLVWSYLSIIEQKQPKAFIFENVKGLITKKHIHTFHALIAKFDEIGFNVSHKVVNAWDHGVAQKRERVIIVGIRKDLGFSYVFPDPLPGDYQTQVLRDAIGDLPDPSLPPKNHDPKPLSDGAMAYMERDPRHFQKHRPPHMDEASATLPAVLHKGVPYGLFYPDNHSGGLFDNVGCNPTWEHANRVADPDQPAPTRTSKDRCDGINEINGRPRRFTVRECLRLQSVPDSYVFPETISLSKQYEIVGNGVASRVAWILGAALAEQLKKAEEAIEDDYDPDLSVSMVGGGF